MECTYNAAMLFRYFGRHLLLLLHVGLSTGIKTNHLDVCHTTCVRLFEFRSGDNLMNWTKTSLRRMHPLSFHFYSHFGWNWNWNWMWCNMTNAMLSWIRTERKFLFYLALNKHKMQDAYDMCANSYGYTNTSTCVWVRVGLSFTVYASPIFVNTQNNSCLFYFGCFPASYWN